MNLAEIRLKQEDELKKQGAGNQNDLDKAKSEYDRLTSDLRSADYQLKATVVRAPADGMASQVLIRRGQFVVPMAFSQVMVFVHAEKPYLFAGFDQNESEFIDAGDDVEVAFDAIPGRVFTGKVKSIQPLLAEGTLTASGGLRTLDDAGKRGKIPVMVR